MATGLTGRLDTALPFGRTGERPGLLVTAFARTRGHCGYRLPSLTSGGYGCKVQPNCMNPPEVSPNRFAFQLREKQTDPDVLANAATRRRQTSANRKSAIENRKCPGSLRASATGKRKAEYSGQSAVRIPRCLGRFALVPRGKQTDPDVVANAATGRRKAEYSGQSAVRIPQSAMLRIASRFGYAELGRSVSRRISRWRYAMAWRRKKGPA